MDELFRGPRTDESADEQVNLRSKRFFEEGLKNHHVDDPELTRILKEIDFDFIRELISEDVRRSIYPRDDTKVTAHTFGRDAVVVTNNEGFKAIRGRMRSVATAYPHVGKLLINAPLLQKQKAYYPHMPFELIVLNLIMHEQNHSASSYWQVREANTIDMQMGLQQSKIIGGLNPSKIDLHELVNEGANQWRTFQLIQKYLTSRPLAGVSAEDAARMSQIYEYNHMPITYFLAVHLLSGMVETIAKDTGVSTDSVWQGIIHAGVNGLNLQSPDAKAELDFDSIFGAGFSEGLAALQSGQSAQSIVDFMQKYKIHMDAPFITTLNNYITHTVTVARAHKASEQNAGG